MNITCFFVWFLDDSNSSWAHHQKLAFVLKTDNTCSQIAPFILFTHYVLFMLWLSLVCQSSPSFKQIFATVLVNRSKGSHHYHKEIYPVIMQMLWFTPAAGEQGNVLLRVRPSDPAPFYSYSYTGFRQASNTFFTSKFSTLTNLNS